MTQVVTKEMTPYQRWQAEIDAAKESAKKFHERARKTTRKFLDERGAVEAGARWFNIFYANVNILESALYAKLPSPSVTRRFKDYQDETARVAALIIQRTVTQDLDDPRDTFDSTMRQCVQDRLVPGLAQAWLRLETDTENIEDVDTTPKPGMETEEVGEGETDPAAEGTAAGEPPQRVTDQRVVVDYIFWEDFLWSPCRVWDERRWVARRVYMTREQLVKRFGAIKGNQVQLDAPNSTSTSGPQQNNENTTVPKQETIRTAAVWEIWERATRKVYWYAAGASEILDERPDPLGLVGFEPCPKSMLANISTSNTIPRPDYYMLQDQYMELDAINNRISLLVQACKVVGVYDKGQPGIVRLLQEGSDNTLIPVDNWAMFAEKGGIKGQVDWLPLDVIVQALRELNDARDRIKAQIYELTGISDIVRGASKASETLGAQQIKAQFAGVRIEKLQNEVARFAGDILRIKAEMQVKHFTPEILVSKSNIMVTGAGNVEYVPSALQMLATDEGFEWRIQVTADSIAQADYAAEKQDRTEFLSAVSSFMEKALPMVQQMPESKPMLVGMLKWGIAGFKNASEIEGMLDKELDAMLKPQPPEPPPPDPAVIKAQAEAQAREQEAKLDAEKQQREMAVDERKAHLEEQRMVTEAHFEQQRQQMNLLFERQSQMLEAAAQRQALAFEAAMQQLKLQGQRESQAAAAAAKENNDGA